METKKQLLTFLSLLCFNSHLQADNKQNLFNLNDQWSINGGVFRPASTFNPDEVQGSDVLIMHADGGFKVIRNQVKVGAKATTKVPHIYVDRAGPGVEVKWHDVHNENGQVVVGPDSSVSLSVNEGSIQKYDESEDVQETTSQNLTFEFDSPVDKLMVLAKDKFNNETLVDLDFKTDFEKPTINWHLKAPALQKNGQWYAKQTAYLNLAVYDNTAVKMVMLNDHQITLDEQALKVQSGDVLKVLDVLGNVNEQLIDWQQDDVPPKLVVNGQPISERNKITLQSKINEVIEIGFVDDGVGIESQEYRGKLRKWMPLPKKFRFLNKGSYRVRVNGIDRVGNQFGANIRIKVKR